MANEFQTEKNIAKMQIAVPNKTYVKALALQVTAHVKPASVTLVPQIET